MPVKPWSFGTRLSSSRNSQQIGISFIESMLFDSELSDAEKLDNLKKYFGEIDDVDYEIITSCIAIVKDTHNLTSGALIEFESWINEQYH